MSAKVSKFLPELRPGIAQLMTDKNVRMIHGLFVLDAITIRRVAVVSCFEFVSFLRFLCDSD